ncbi:MAG: NAD(P)-dependent oxidoreductase [Gammaproteobacteria bacterium]|nr:NAD(P)-dependent oxidoreductase [Gammaproteobacteria bacterium]
MATKTKTIVVTGAAGFVGGHLVNEFSGRGYRVIAADLQSDTLDRYAQLPNVVLRAGDLTDLNYCSDLISGADGVVHCAGASRVSSAVNAPLNALKSTVLASGNLFETIRQQGDKWLVVTSTREVENNAVAAGNSSALADLYGICKFTVEQLARSFCLEAGIPLVICRLSDVYGSQRDHANKLLPIFLMRSLVGDPLEIRDTATKYCFTHIDDVIAGIAGAVKQLEDGQIRFQLRKIWGERWITAPELAQLIKEISVSESRHVISPMAPGAQFSASLDKDTLWDFSETISLEEGLKRMSNFQS